MANNPKNIITGAKAIVKIDGKVAGYATGVSISENTLNGRVESLGFIDTRELTPISRQVSASINLIRIFQSTTANGLNEGEVDEQGDKDGQRTYGAGMINTEVASDGLTEIGEDDRTDNMFRGGGISFDLEIWDSAPGTAPAGSASSENRIYTLKGCKVASHNIVVDRTSLMGVQIFVEGLYLIRHYPAALISVADD